jgi:hypothetical protein
LLIHFAGPTPRPAGLLHVSYGTRAIFIDDMLLRALEHADASGDVLIAALLSQSVALVESRLTEAGGRSVSWSARAGDSSTPRRRARA